MRLFDELLGDYLEDALDEGGLAELAACVLDADQRRRFLDLTGVDGLLRGHYAPRALGDTLLDRLDLTLASPRQEALAVRGVMERIAPKPSRPRWPIFAAAAAAVATLILGILATVPRPADPSPKIVLTVTPKPGGLPGPKAPEPTLAPKLPDPLPVPPPRLEPPMPEPLPPKAAPVEPTPSTTVAGAPRKKVGSVAYAASAWRIRGNDRTTLTGDVELLNGDSVETTGGTITARVRPLGASLALGEGRTVDLADGTLIEVGDGRVRLTRGLCFADAAKPLTVETPAGEVAGAARFEIRCDFGTTSVRVETGKVHFAGREVHPSPVGGLWRGRWTSGLAREPIPLSKVRSWAYQIQQLDETGAVDALAASPYDLLVVEPSRTNRQESRFDTRGMVEQLKAAPASDGIHRKLVIAYLSIGEAEDWRWYWTWSKNWKKGSLRPPDWPAFIADRDPDGWAGNYPVAYWDPDWKDIVLHGKKHPATGDRNFVSVMDEVLLDGFDGIYLDWVEAWENESVVAAARKEGRNAAKEMVTLIREMREMGLKKNRDFVVIQQNAASLAEKEPDLFKVVDAIAQEDVWYLGEADTPWGNPKGYDKAQEVDLTKSFIEELKTYQKAGKPVFTIDYTVKHAPAVYAKARGLGFIPYCSRTSLSRLTTTPAPDLEHK